MPSLLDAIEAKYGQDGRDCEHSEAPIGIRVPRIGPRKSIPRLLILNDCNVDSAGEENQLEKTCSGVLEIDLAHNRLTEWSEISKILQYSPAVTFLNLSFNSLATPVTLTCHENTFQFPFLPRLNTLILIGTSITWDTVWFLLKRATTLQELHLSMNDFKTVDLTSSRHPCCRVNANNASREDDAEKENNDGRSSRLPRIDEDSGSYSDSGVGSSSDDDDGICFPHLKRLMFDGNPISSWDEVAKLGMCFQSLRHLGLSDCPIEEITEDACQYFENLQSLSLSNTLIHDLEQVSRLNLLSSLTELRIQGIPLLHDMTAHERRQLLVALLKNVKKLNGGAPISITERESAERAFIRHFAQSEDPNKPQRYYELLAIHGELAPLIDVQFKPNEKIKVRICYEQYLEEHEVSIYQTTHELKTTLEPVLGISPSKMRLFYVDPALQGVFGREELRLPHKQLYSYNMQDGDEIHIEQKLTSSMTLSTTSSGTSGSGGTGRDSGPSSPTN